MAGATITKGHGEVPPPKESPGALYVVNTRKEQKESDLLIVWFSADRLETENPCVYVKFFQCMQSTWKLPVLLI